jgi:hypothetical protein
VGSSRWHPGAGADRPARSAPGGRLTPGRAPPAGLPLRPSRTRHRRWRSRLALTREGAHEVSHTILTKREMLAAVHACRHEHAGSATFCTPMGAPSVTSSAHRRGGPSLASAAKPLGSERTFSTQQSSGSPTRAVTRRWAPRRYPSPSAAQSSGQPPARRAASWSVLRPPAGSAGAEAVCPVVVSASRTGSGRCR